MSIVDSPGEFLENPDTNKIDNESFKKLYESSQEKLNSLNELLLIKQNYAKAFDKIARIIITETNINEILQKITEIFGEAINIDRCLIYDVNYSNNLLIGLGEWINPKHPEISHSKAKYSIDSFRSAVEEMAKTKTFLESHFDNVNPFATQNQAEEILHNGLKIKSGLWYPFHFNSNGYFLLVLNSIIDKRIWTPDIIDFLQSVSTLADVALEKLKATKEKEDANALLKDKSTILQTLLDNLPIGIWMSNSKRRVEFVNKRIIETTGISEYAYLNTIPYYSIYGEKLYDEYEKSDKDALKSDNPISTVLRFKDKNGKLRFVESTKKRVLNDKGVPTKIIGFATDITERLLHEQELIKQDLFLNAITKASQILLSEKQSDRSIPQALEIVGKTIEQDRAYIFEYHVNPDTGENLMSQRFEWSAQEVEAQIDNPVLQNLSFDTIAPRWLEKLSKGESICGDVKDFPENEQPILTEQGIITLLALPIILEDKFWGFVGFDSCKANYLWSATEKSILTAFAASLGQSILHWRAEQELLLSREQFELAVKGSNDGIWDWNLRNGDLFLSPKWKEQLGYEDHELKNEFSTFHMLLHPDDEKHVLALVDEHLSGDNELYKIEFRIRHKDGSYRWMLARGMSFRDSNGVPVRMSGSHTDITDRKLNEKALRESEEKYRLISENTTDGILVFNAMGEVTYSSPSFLKIMGITDFDAKYLAELSIYELIHPADRDELFAKIKKAIDEKKSELRYEYRAKHNLGYYIWREDNAKFLYNEDNIYSGAYVVCRDVSQRKTIETELLKSEQKLNFFVENSPMAVIEWDSDLRISRWIGDSEKIFGFSQEETIGKKRNELNLIYEEDIPHTDQIANKLIHGNLNSVFSVNRNYRKDGSVIYCEWYNTVMKDENGKIISALSQVLDITKRVKAEKELIKFYNAVEQSQVSIMIVNLEGNIEYVNPKFESVTGYSREEVKNQNPRFLKSNHFSQDDYLKLWGDLTTGKEWSGTFLNKKKNGDLFWESAFITPIKDNTGNITHYLAVKEDITTDKKMELELRDALDKAEEMNIVKSNFLANMNHELRTPLNGILGFSQILYDSLQGTEHAEKAESILSSGYRLSQTLNMIIDLSNLESEKLQLTKKDLDVVAIIKKNSDMFTNLAKQKNLNFNLIIKHEPIFASIDQDMFLTALSNLVDNAIKFTESGEVVIEVDIDKSQTTQMIIKVTDTGIGIPKDKLDVIWDAFRQASEGLNRSFEGSGLGLTISKRIITLMKGTLSAHSEVGKGSVFCIKIPIIKNFYSKPKDIIMPEKDAQVTKLLKVLYVEDDKINQNLVKLFLRNQYHYDTADNASEALQKIEETTYDIILMDINLGPGMNGAQAANIIRKNTNYKDTPIIAVTAYTSENDKKSFFNLGCSHYLSKPFMKNDLLTLIEESIKK